jgi:DNA repair protein RadC
MNDSRIVDGNYEGYRVSLRLIREGKREFEPHAINNSRQAYDFYKGLSGLDREVFYATHLDQRNQVLSCEEVSRGALAATIVHPREVYKSAILSSAAAILVAHNHPSGDPSPSEDDLQLTGRLVEAGKILGIPVLDSIIIGDGRYYSMRDEGRI